MNKRQPRRGLLAPESRYVIPNARPTTPLSHVTSQSPPRRSPRNLKSLPSTQVVPESDLGNDTATGIELQVERTPPQEMPGQRRRLDSVSSHDSDGRYIDLKTSRSVSYNPSLQRASSNSVGLSDEEELMQDTSEEELSEPPQAHGDRPRVHLPLADHTQHWARMEVKQARFDFAEELRYGLTAVAHAAYIDQTMEEHAVAKRYTEAKFLQIAITILASMPLKLLDTIISRNLHCAVVAGHDNDLLKMYNSSTGTWRKRTEYVFAPGVYCKHLVSEKGLSPSANELYRITARLRHYVQGGSIDAMEIDNAMRTNRSSIEDVNRGGHFYLNGSRGRTTKVITFCQALDNRLDGMPDKDGPLPIPLKYVGYSKQVNERQKAHRNGSSSWLMQLVLAACRVEFGARYKMYDYPVCFLADQNEASIAEVLISVITDSVYNTGGGFGVFQCGVQVGSAKQDDLPFDQRDANWVSCQEFRSTCTPCTKNLEKEHNYLLQVRKSGGHKLVEKPMQARMRKLEAENEQLRKDIHNASEEKRQWKAELRGLCMRNYMEVISILETLPLGNDAVADIKDDYRRHNL
jgi:hypothetical protein